MVRRVSLPLILALALGACGSAPPRAIGHAARPPAPPLPVLPWDTERPVEASIESGAIALVGGTVMTATGRIIPGGVVWMEDGRIVQVGADDEVEIPPGAQVIDVRGRFVTPGIIDTHSHMGVYPVPSVQAHDDGNEATSPVTAQVRAADSFWPQDPSLARALQAGVTTIQVLPGSANLIGGAGETVKMHLGRSVSEMIFPNAPDTMKMACGENPKRVYGAQHQAPSTRMGNVAGYRRAFQDAIEYGHQWSDWQQNHRLWAIRQARFAEAQGSTTPNDSSTADTEGAAASAAPDDPGPAPAPPSRDFGRELLLGAVQGRVLVQMHCYRADEMARMIEVSHEFGFRIRAFHHAVEAYKIRDLLAAEQISVSTWADWWGFKLEAFDAIPENLALLTEAGVRTVLHSDSPMLIQRLNQEAAKGMTSGRAAGIDVTEDQALRWITAEPAWTLGIEDRTGTLEAGKMADIVVWSAHPLSTFARADLVFVDGILEHDRTRPPYRTDFELGLDLEPEPDGTSRATSGGAR